MIPLLILPLLLGGGVVAYKVSDTSLPGDSLYNVKTIGESIKVALTPESGRSEVYLDLANKRLEEAEKMAEKGESADKIANVLQRYSQFLSKAGATVQSSGSDQGSEVDKKFKETTERQNRVLDKVVKNNTGSQTDNDLAKVAEETKKESEKVTSQVSQNSTSSNSSNSYQAPYSTPQSGTSNTASSPSPSRPSVVPSPSPSPSPVATPSPSSITNSYASVNVYALIHAGFSDSVVYRGRVRIKNPSGIIINSGLTDSNGYYRVDNLPSNQTVDVILVQPEDYATQYCGDKQSVTLNAGGYYPLTMRLGPLGSNPCETP